MFKQHSLALIWATTFFLGACGNSTKDDEPSVVSENNFAQVVLSAKKELEENNSAAVSIAIYHDGNIVFADAFGKDKLDEGASVSKNTLFQIGSTTKMLTALAAMRMVDDGVITIQDSLVMAVPNIQYLQDQRYDWSDITVHHLLTHQGGFVDDYQDISSNDLLLDYMSNTFGNTEPLMINAGRFYNYSNPNYSYLGAIMEYYGQQEYHELMKRFVFEPLQMDRTTLQKDDVLADGDFALGVYEDENGVKKGFESVDDIEQLLPILPAGSYTWSTPSEVLKMADFLLNGNNEILSDNLRSEMIAKQISLEQYGLPLHYGYGIYVDDGFIYDDKWYEEKLWQHGGNRHGYTSKMWVLPEKNLAVSILSSGSGDDYSETMIRAIESVVDLPTPIEIPAKGFDVSTFDNHIGTYQSGGLLIEITNNGDELGITIPEFDANNIPYEPILQPIAEDTFIGSQQSVLFEVRFFPQNHENDRSIYIRNRNFVATRLGY